MEVPSSPASVLYQISSVEEVEIEEQLMYDQRLDEDEESDRDDAGL